MQRTFTRVLLQLLRHAAVYGFAADSSGFHDAFSGCNNAAAQQFCIKCFVQVVTFAGQCRLIDIYFAFAQNSIRRDALSCLQQNQITAHDIIRGNDNDAAAVAPHTAGYVGGFCLHPAKCRIAAVF